MCSIPRVPSLKSPFQISLSCGLQKCIFDSVQNKPVLPLLKCKGILWYFQPLHILVPTRAMPVQTGLSNPTDFIQVSYNTRSQCYLGLVACSDCFTVLQDTCTNIKAHRVRDHSVTRALQHFRTVSPSQIIILELPLCSLVLRESQCLTTGVSSHKVLYSTSNPFW